MRVDRPLRVIADRGAARAVRRARAGCARILSALARAVDRFGMRIVHYSIQRDHVHLIVEASSHVAITRGVKGLCVRIARKLNRMMERKCAVFADR